VLGNVFFGLEAKGRPTLDAEAKGRWLIGLVGLAAA